MIPDRLARNPVNHAYERGWAEGWAAALAAVEQRGLEAVLAGEERLRPVPLTLVFQPEPPDSSGARRIRGHSSGLSVLIVIHCHRGKEK